MVKVGDKVKEIPVSFRTGHAPLIPPEGTVIYVHPEGRYCTVEYVYLWDGERRAFRESYPLKTKPTCPPWEAE